MNYQQLPGITFDEVDEGKVVFDHANDTLHLLNESAADILRLCATPQSPAALAGALAHSYGLETPPLTDVEACLAALVAAGLVRQVDG